MTGRSVSDHQANSTGSVGQVQASPTFGTGGAGQRMKRCYRRRLKSPILAGMCSLAALILRGNAAKVAGTSQPSYGALRRMARGPTICNKSTPPGRPRSLAGDLELSLLGRSSSDLGGMSMELAHLREVTELLAMIPSPSHTSLRHAPSLSLHSPV